MVDEKQFDYNSLRASDETLPSTKKQKLEQKKKNIKYLHIDNLNWALNPNLTPNEFKLAICILYAQKLKGAKCFPLSPNIVKCFHLDKMAVHRGIQHLEELGMIQVQRKQGKAPMITILETDVENS